MGIGMNYKVMFSFNFPKIHNSNFNFGNVYTKGPNLVLDW